MAVRAFLPLLAAAAAAGCGGSSGGTAASSEVPDPGDPGAAVTQSNGCLACHELGTAGNAKIGGSLTRIGGKLSPREIEQALVDPPDGMPSFDHVSAADRRRMVDYLAGLR